MRRRAGGNQSEARGRGSLRRFVEHSTREAKEHAAAACSLLRVSAVELAARRVSEVAAAMSDSNAREELAVGAAHLGCRASSRGNLRPGKKRGELYWNFWAPSKEADAAALRSSSARGGRRAEGTQGGGGAMGGGEQSCCCVLP
jgi:hypothetical protein